MYFYFYSIISNLSLLSLSLIFYLSTCFICYSIYLDRSLSSSIYFEIFSPSNLSTSFMISIFFIYIFESHFIFSLLFIYFIYLSCFYSFLLNSLLKILMCSHSFYILLMKIFTSFNLFCHIILYPSLKNDGLKMILFYS